MSKKRDRGPRGTGPNSEFRNLGDVQKEYEQNKLLFDSAPIRPRPEPEVMRPRNQLKVKPSTRTWKTMYALTTVFATLRFFFMVALCIQLMSLGFTCMNVSGGIQNYQYLIYQGGAVAFLAAATALCTILAQFFSEIGINHLRKNNAQA